MRRIRIPLKRRNDDTFLTDLFANIFGVLKFLTPLNLIKRVAGCRLSEPYICVNKQKENGAISGKLSRNSNLAYAIDEICIVVWYAIYILWVSTGRIYNSKCINILFCILAFLRIYDITIFHINQLLFDRYRFGPQYKIMDPTRLIVLLLLNIIEIVFWFSALYNIVEFFYNINAPSLFSYIRISTHCFWEGSMVEGYLMSSWPWALKIVWYVQYGIGKFMVIAVLSRFIGLLPQVNSWASEN